MSHDVIPPAAQEADKELLEPPLLEDEDARALEYGQAAAAAEDPPIRPLEGEAPGPEAEAEEPPDEPSVEGREDLPEAEGQADRSLESVANRRYVAAAERFGCRPGLGRLIVQHARKYGIPISLGFALIDHESDFRKVFGHDPTIFSGAGEVTKPKYLDYRAKRRASGNRMMQGVGEGQLTWWETQDRADTHGGCWTAEANVKVAFMTLGALIKQLGYAQGIERYNGSGPNAVRYSREVRAEAKVWHDRLA